MGKSTKACDFNDMATISTSNPSHGSCIFAGSLGRYGNAPAPSPSPSFMDSHSSACELRIRSLLIVIGLIIWGVLLL
ncbi:glucan endo-1,3-beta-D-glucosidase [Trifolium repens]|nr:glucan endo-1,3-beta-D-glucosidase [Trifolium repens]